MTMRALLLSALAAGFVGQAVSAEAQVRWGRGSAPRAGVCFYEDTDLRGDYFCASAGDRIATLPSGMGDRISSMRVYGDADVTVFQDRSFHGRSARFGTDVLNLKRQGWNDTISSIVVGVSRRDDRGNGRWDDRGNGRWNDRGPVWNDRRDNRTDDWSNGGYGRGPAWGRGSVPREGACFYEDSNFRGRYFCLSRGDSYASMPGGFNDRISSIRVFGSGVSLYRDDEFRGRSTRVNRDVPNLGSTWGDRISSLRVF